MKKITVILFFALLFLFSISYFLFPSKEFSENENRYLYKFSNIRLNSVSSDFENYLSDNFIFRDNMMMLNTLFKKGIGYFEINEVIFDKDYLYNNYNYYNTKILKSNISKINELCLNYDINLVLVPSSIKTFDKYGFSDLEKNIIKDIYNKVKSNNIDVFSILNKNDYFKMDHHINHLGARKIYEVLTGDKSDFDYELVSSDFKGTTYSKSGAFWYKGEDLYKIKGQYNWLEIYYDNVKQNSIFDDSKLYVKDKYSYYLSGNHGVVNIKTDVNNNKSIVLIKDSYANILTPYLIDSYSDITLIDLRFFKGSLNNVLKDKNEIYVFYSLNGFINDVNFGVIK